jgi:hypothetical protein
VTKPVPHPRSTAVPPSAAARARVDRVVDRVRVVAAEARVDGGLPAEVERLVVARQLVLGHRAMVAVCDGRRDPLPSGHERPPRHWPLDPEITFLNHGSFGACPTPVLETQQELRARMEANPVHFMVRELEPMLDRRAPSSRRFSAPTPTTWPSSRTRRAA